MMVKTNRFVCFRRVLVFCMVFFSGLAVFHFEEMQLEAKETADSEVVSKNDHIWLYVEGKYIKTSPYADPPNQIFVGAGVAVRHNYSGPYNELASWIKSKGCNVVRFSLSIIPYPIGSGKVYPALYDTLEENFEKIIEPFVQVCKENEFYVYIDIHEYFHRYRDKDSWLAGGEVWNDSDFQLWVDYWTKIANRYKDEPWVMGYELCNEPYNVPSETSRGRYMECIKAIRQIDTRHIILLGNDNYTHIKSMERVWKPVKFRPDKPYNQIVFAFHEYTNADNPDIVAPVLDRIQQKYDVPVFCTEFGSDATVPGLTEEMKRQFEKNMFAMFRPRKIGWSIWRVFGVLPDLTGPKYFDIWEKAVPNHASPIPKPGTSLQQATQILLAVNPDTLPSDGISMATVTAVLCDTARWRVDTATNTISFEVISKKEGVAKLEGLQSVAATNGTATAKLKAGSIKGKVTVKASSDGLTPAEATARIVKKK